MASSGIQTRIGAGRKPAMIARQPRQHQMRFISRRFTRINADQRKIRVNLRPKYTLTAPSVQDDNASRHENLSISTAWISPAARNRLFRSGKVGTSGHGRDLASW